MKCLVVSVLVLVAVVFTVNCHGDVSGQHGGSSSSNGETRLVEETPDTELHVVPDQPQGRRSLTDNAQQLVITDIAQVQHKEREEDHEIDIRNRTKRSITCSDAGGTCMPTNKQEKCKKSINRKYKCSSKKKVCCIEEVSTTITPTTTTSKPTDEVVNQCLKTGANNSVILQTLNNVDHDIAHKLLGMEGKIINNITQLQDDIKIELTSTVNILTSNMDQDLAKFANQIDTHLNNTLNETITSLEDDIDMKIDTLELQLKNKIEKQTGDLDEIIVKQTSDLDEIIVKQTIDLDEIIVKQTTDLDEIIVKQTSDLDEIIVKQTSDLDEIIVKQTTDLDEIIVNLKDDIDIKLQGVESKINNITQLQDDIAIKLEGVESKITQLQDDIAIKLEGVESKITQLQETTIAQLDEMEIKMEHKQDEMETKIQAKLDYIIKHLDCVSIGSQCFTFSEDGDVKNWADAVSECVTQGNRLAIPADPQAVLDYLRLNYGKKWWWVGGSDRNNEGVWAWVNGALVDDSLPWYGAEPGGGSSQNCLLVNGLYGYFDDPCTNRFRYICEIVL